MNLYQVYHQYNKQRLEPVRFEAKVIQSYTITFSYIKIKILRELLIIYILYSISISITLYVKAYANGQSLYNFWTYTSITF